MQILNYLRNLFFWTNDIIKSGRINLHFKEVNLILKEPASATSLEIRQRNLINVLTHAINTTPFYKLYKNGKEITDFPIIRKTDIQNNFEQFQSKLYKDKPNYKLTTSGSTGIPFFLYQDDNKRNRNRADVIYFLKRCNFEVGNRLYHLAVWREYNQKGVLKSWLQNVVQFDISRFTDYRINEFINLLKKDTNKIKTILGLASSLEMIAHYVEKHEMKFDNLKLNSIIANSEYLSSYTKTTIGKYFNTEVLSRYSSEEIGIVAHQTIDSPNNFILNHASYHIEVLNLDNDKPVKSGELGRIVVTDLFNYAMPIIRYDTGDVAKLTILDNGNTEFEQIEGRKMDLIYDSQGNIISSYVIYAKFYKYYKLLKQFQFIQQDKKDYEVKLNLQGDEFDFENELIEDIKNDFGKDANVFITYVDEIPSLASGKRRIVVNNNVKNLV
ncbi:MAG: CoF synthetase [Bacteroidetes bacterium]|nr:MAG: CoF synthetase [Bacteroidota bacterium]